MVSGALFSQSVIPVNSGAVCPVAASGAVTLSPPW